MKKSVQFGVMAAATLVASSAYAQDSVSSASGFVPLAAALAIGISAFAAASAQGKALSSALEAIGRNPSAKDAISQPLLLGLVFMEFQALLGFVIAFLWTLK